MKISDVNEQFSKVVSEIKRLNYLLGDECSKVDVDYSNPNEKFLFNEFTEAQNSLNQVAKMIDYLNAEIYLEGELELQENGRFTLEGYEFTSGNRIDILDPEDDCWYLSRIEHNGEHYYCVVIGRNKKIAGYRARLRRWFNY